MLAQQLASGGQVQSTIYQICIRGRVTERLGSALEGMRLEAGANDTVFTGEIRDQSQLYGLLDRVRDLGLELVSVQPQLTADPETLTPIRKDL
ncbi:hypothetical protein [Mycobacterium marseillense]|uniref:Uncharacterized protein n=1 Tax=Mycobacterium marseillense TaxID=701042 RepID=A0ABM7JA56_9MYCO|nr:hypothetical protein [Mycobacterium marseillense]MCV7407982.1 hypothetical protein [Mycobacterium marseillense]ORA86887.1 hypothetical protein BST31_22435 [Mycobacterium marseillense]BBY10720.1 hypothetical protein MMARJ_14600 [Mycobacterium marseillense]